LINCGLKEISSRDLLEFSNLFLLDLSDNDLEFLPFDLFDPTPQLKMVNFANNKLFLICHELFDKFPSMMKVNFQNNPGPMPIIDLYYDFNLDQILKYQN
jgi:hypothetical protein